jgi:hypothetical protein
MVQAADKTLEELEKAPSVKTIDVKDKVWPKVIVEAVINSTPIQAAGIFAAYDYQTNYIEGLKMAKIHAQNIDSNQNDIQVAYTLAMPWPLGDSHYIHGHKISTPTPGSYQVNWYMVKSDSVDDINGFARFSPIKGKEGKTLMHYETLVSPKSFLAGVFKKLMVGDVLKSVKAVKGETEKLLKKDIKIVDKYADKIRLVLDGKKAY